MRIRLFVLLLFLAILCWGIFQKPTRSFTFIPFEEGQLSVQFSPKQQLDFYDRLKNKKWRRLHRLYRWYLEGKRKSHKKEKIPKIIHQVWLDGPLPQNYYATVQSWIKYHPEWEYHLWTKEEIRYLYLQNQPLFEEASAESQVEILRYEILYQFGGLFVDVDVECIKAFDILHELCDFYAGVEQNIRTPFISSSIIGASAGHRLIKYCIQELKKKSSFTLDPLFLTHSFFTIVKKNHPQANVILPAAFFHPHQNEIEYTFALPHQETETTEI